jgi:hypothetical protein
MEWNTDWFLFDAFYFTRARELCAAQPHIFSFHCVVASFWSQDQASWLPQERGRQLVFSCSIAVRTRRT